MNGSLCIPAVHWKTGELMKESGARQKARKILIQREGLPPFEGAVCRHLCENDSMAPNGFVCTAHTTWGTQSENCQDKSPEMRARSASAGGKIGGRIGGKIGGKIWVSRPDHPSKAQVTCPHCGKTTNKLNAGQWHFDRCKYRNPEETCV